MDYEAVMTRVEREKAETGVRLDDPSGRLPYPGDVGIKTIVSKQAVTPRLQRFMQRGPCGVALRYNGTNAAEILATFGPDVDIDKVQKTGGCWVFRDDNGWFSLYTDKEFWISFTLEGQTVWP